MKKFTLVISIIMFFTSFVACTSNFNAYDRTTEYVMSSAISKQVRTNIADQLGINSLKYIAVSTYRGIVKITGTVRTQQDMQKAIQAVTSTVGVIGVENCLKINPHTPWS